MKFKKALLPLILASTTMMGLAGCAKKVKAGGSNIIQIKSYKGGYGTDFLHEMADKFKTVYPDYSVEFLDESSLLDGEKAAEEG